VEESKADLETKALIKSNNKETDSQLNMKVASGFVEFQVYANMTIIIS